MDFIPPLVTAGASHALLETIRSIQGLLLSRCRLLDIYKGREALAGSQSGSPFTSFLALRSLNRYIPVLSHMAEAVDLHPWHFYGVLRQLAGELSSFSVQYDALGRLKDGSERIAPYDHQNLGHCFQTAALLIEEMLDGLTGGTETSIALQREGEYFRAKIPADFFDAQYDYYLQVRTRENRQKLVDMAGHVVKVGSDEEIELLMSRALPGVRIEPVKGPVPGLAEVPDVINMRADTSSRSWDEVKKRRAICLYWKDAPADMTVALIITKGREGNP
jgi:type VI secretion system protein ImpJ